MKYARIEAGVVVEIIPVPTLLRYETVAEVGDDGAATGEYQSVEVGNVTLADLYHPDFVAACRPCSDEVEAGWILDGDSFVPPPAEPAVDLLAYAADRRWQVEVGGITIGGVPVATDDRSKIMIMGARVAAAADPDWTTVWHGSDGQTYPVDATAMIAISDAVQAHVNAGFATFAAVKAAIDAGEITTTAAIDEAFAAA